MAVHPRLGFLLWSPATVLLVLVVAVTLVDLSPVVAQECEPCPTGQYRLTQCTDGVQPSCYPIICSTGFFLGDDGVCQPCIRECEAGGFLVGQCTAFTSTMCLVCAVTDTQCLSVMLSETLSAAHSAVAGTIEAAVTVGTAARAALRSRVGHGSGGHGSGRGGSGRGGSARRQEGGRR